MENKTSTILTQAQQEISEKGVLSFPTRRKLWLAFGPWEVREEEYRFPSKPIKAFQEKRNPPRPVPEEVTLESLTEYLEVGDLRYCCRILGKRDLSEGMDSVSYHIVTRRPDKGGVWARCYLDEKDALKRVETTTRFRVQIGNAKRDKQNLALGLKALGAAEAEKLAEALAEKKKGCEEIDCLSGLSRAGAKQALNVLCKCDVECRIMPHFTEKGGDTW